MKKWINFGIVNFFTTIRMVGIFLLVPIYLTYGGIALGITNIACFLTDFIDGKLAKKLNASTFFGSLYDGLSDKAFLGVNLAILCTLTPWAILPIFLELGIMGVQYTKYKLNKNIQSNIFGKLKMWVAGISVIIANLLIDVEKLNFLGTEILGKLASISTSSLVEKALLALVFAELITLVSYILEAFKKEDEKIINEAKISEEKDNDSDLEKIAKDKENILQQKEELLSLKEMLFDTDFYMQHKDESGLKLLRERAKKGKK